jgi:hypothetical protein
MRKLFLPLAAIALLISCTKEKATAPSVTLPSTYNFENVDLSKQTTLVGMLTEIATETRKGTTEDLSATRLLNMYHNTGAPFSNADFNTSGESLSEETFPADVALFDTYLQQIAATSLLRTNTVTAGGQAGTAVSITDNTKKYLVDSNGVEYSQLIQKGLMGALIYYRICEDEIAQSTLDASDNSTVIPGKGTKMQHEWDEAFGYWGVPVTLTAENFDSLNAARKLYFYGNYSEKGEALDIVSKLLVSFIKGRDAIGRKDYVTRDAAAADIRKDFELINACAYISYLNQSVAAFNDYAVRCHTMSEGYGFFHALEYNSGKLISQSDFEDIDAQYHVAGKLSFAHLTSGQLATIRDRISNIYGLNSIKNNL